VLVQGRKSRIKSGIKITGFFRKEIALVSIFTNSKNEIVHLPEIPPSLPLTKGGEESPL
jgi:hypothetical protein